MDKGGATFFDQLAECAKREGERHPGSVSPETMRELCAAPAPPGFVRPKPFRPAAPKTEPAAAARPAVPAAAPASPDDPPEVKLEKMRLFSLKCKRCPLAATRTNVVYGEGDPHARLMFIGEGPGADEDRLGRPFVGRAGQLLDKMIAAMHFAREEVYIANVVKCRPPGNRVPTPEEAMRCIGYLERQIRFIKPEVIVLLGATAATFLLDRHEGISKLRGIWQEYDGIPVMPTFHPAFLLRQESAKREAWHDLQLVMAKLGK
jgi:DNA polymerase